MKHLVFTLMIVLMSMMASTPVSAKSNKKDLTGQVLTAVLKENEE